MKKIIILTIFSVVLCLTNGDNVVVPPEPPSVSTIVPPNPITTSPATTTTTTPAPHTNTTLVPITTPSPPTTIAPKPTTTTAATTTSTTVAPSPNTTTIAPTTTVAPAPTTIKPTPKPKPETHTWVVNYTGTNNTCIVVKMALEIEVPYEKTDKKIENATVVVPTTAEVTGSCVPNTTHQNLTLSWNQDNVTFTFEKNATSNKFMLHSVVAIIVPDHANFPNASSNNTIVASHTKNEFLTPVDMSYRCKQEEDYILALPGSNQTGKFIVKDLQLQAFRNVTGKDFDSAKDCESGETPGIVPIAVGCSLAALIIVVLVAYLVGRRRSQARGYLSMFAEKQREAEYIPMKNISCFGK